jgi:HAD superfamily hydrolase (TIGR01549 family)
MNMIKVVLFDLDGTLLPMDQDVFVQNYFGRLAKKLAPYGYDAKKLVDAIWTGTAAMVKNTGELNNEAVFWNKFDEIYGTKASNDKPLFEEFYKNEFQEVEAVCGKNPQAAETVQKIKELGFRVALATNPIFPSIATESRMRWAGLSRDWFEFYTTYENSYHCKPNPEYYKDILKQLQVEADECLMVGNDVTEDMIAETVGMHVFLLTDCIINKGNKEISAYPNGNFEKLLKYLQ